MVAVPGLLGAPVFVVAVVAHALGVVGLVLVAAPVYFLSESS